MNKAIIEVNGLAAGYVKGLNILQGIDLVIKKDEIISIIGPNGAGKSTLLKAIMGLIPISGGRLYINGSEVTNVKSHELVKMGIGYVPQVSNVFPTLTVEENLEIGLWTKSKDIKKNKDEIFDLFPILFEKKRNKAGNLSGGQRQLLALGRALISKPDVLLLDEPSAGLSPIAIDEVFKSISEINETGVSILLVEQNAKRALSFCDRGYVLDQGKNSYTGTGDDLLDDPKVIDLYLGKL
ncbi:ABC transporter ATP-binding protein [Acidimicrobiia bacterium]|jgi:branched-chain amino acid transport system ATP-binding protein|nr:ABC transporter ATP-binding protein [Acidimicrobiia bacterium]MDA9645546.1 ABC transporter ATP-binding protein [Candidatus Actinomarina sp.]MDB4249486.1 ABC transporter ATP-binding protein [Acidimicrobiia bacterium]|tara:strand:- start:550 stop:1266 length:717 start_codon:yes stop_codon:yes gene_type:complete